MASPFPPTFGERWIVVSLMLPSGTRSIGRPSFVLRSCIIVQAAALYSEFVGAARSGEFVGLLIQRAARSGTSSVLRSYIYVRAAYEQHRRKRAEQALPSALRGASSILRRTRRLQLWAAENKTLA